jgi:predicted adenylyl cyclase CyaB
MQMKITNVEIKAICHDLDKIRNKLRSYHADLRGRDHQLDTYFNAGHGRLKLREGNIENQLIYYERPDKEGPKVSHCLLYETKPATILKSMLESAMGVRTRIEKKREIYRMGNIQVHLDEVMGLGNFIEIEAQGTEDEFSEDDLLGQCIGLMRDLGIRDADLVKGSYSDMTPE